MEPAITILAIFTVAVLIIGIHSSWEYAALLAMACTIAPLFLVPSQYFDFLKITLFDAEIYKVTVFTYLLVFVSVVVGYAFNSWLKVIFVGIFLALIAYKLGLLGNVPVDISLSLGGKNAAGANIG